MTDTKNTLNMLNNRLLQLSVLSCILFTLKTMFFELTLLLNLSISVKIYHVFNVEEHDPTLSRQSFLSVCQRRQRNFPDFPDKSKFFNVAEQARTLALYGLVYQKSTSRTKSKSFEALGHSNFRCHWKPQVNHLTHLSRIVCHCTEKKTHFSRIFVSVGRFRYTFNDVYV